MKNVRAKKFLGQHFLEDPQIASNIADALTDKEEMDEIIEVGPGMGVLSQYLWSYDQFKAIEIDRDSIKFLKKKLPEYEEKIIEGDFLQMEFTGDHVGIIGNFPYSISSQILFKALENRSRVVQVVGMFQKEVAERVCSLPRKKSYGILSVLLQQFFETEYLFEVGPENFDPPPKVTSAVIRLKRKLNVQLKHPFEQTKQVIKLAFLSRRKTLRNGLKGLFSVGEREERDTVYTSIAGYFSKRPEELTYTDFEAIAIATQAPLDVLGENHQEEP